MNHKLFYWTAFTLNICYVCIIHVYSESNNRKITYQTETKLFNFGEFSKKQKKIHLQKRKKLIFYYFIQVEFTVYFNRLRPHSVNSITKDIAQ